VDPQRIALVTGANKGIGLEVARGLAHRGVTVLLGARQVPLGEAATATLRSEGHDAHFVELDVTRPDTIAAAAQWIESEFGRLDILVNNAATGLDVIMPSEVDEANFRHILETNLIGPFVLIKATLPLLRRSSAPRIVNVSSDFGSLTLNADPKMPHSQAICLAYPASKAALNQLTVQFAKEFRGTAIKINSVNPGFTNTDMINSVGMQSPRTAAQGAKAIIEMALAGDDGPTGGFFDEDGPLPW
jgi:NAD(P)-dependent dehydrogenase (short-subunit alcohol dehydrogenase family)